MATDEIKELHDILTALRIEVGKITEKLDALKHVAAKVDEAEKKASEAAMSAANAHQRLEKIEKTMYWLMTTVIGTLITGALLFLMNGGFSS